MMESLNKYFFVFVAEGLFLALVGVAVFLLISRRELRKLREQMTRRDSAIAALRQRLELAHENLETAQEKIKQLEAALQEPQDDKLLQNYQQRIANLEKFKDLYFELEDRVSQAEDDSQQIEELQRVIDSQNRALADLKSELSVISKNYGMELDLTEQLKAKIRELEEGSEAMQTGLDHVKEKRGLLQTDVGIDGYKERVRELENTETRLQRELTAHARRIQELEARAAAPSTYGVVRVKEMEDLNNRLKQRENEIRRLRQECETIGIQYEELATKSLAMVGDRGDLTDEQKAQLEGLKRLLDENATALARKQAECEMLENYYLELEQSAEAGDAAERMEQSYAERNVLQDERRDLNTQVEDAADKGDAEEMVKLRQVLAEKEATLEEIRREYKEIKEQFVEVAEEETQLRQKNRALEQECEQLRNELREVNEARQGLADQQKELEKLRSEYSKMEARYVALVEKKNVK